MDQSVDLSQAIDIHLHPAPDVAKRKLDDLDAARDASKVGMRAIVLKSHIMPTVGRAYLVNKISENIKVFGGVCLNESVGGVNPGAVKPLSGLGEMAFVWMPTTSAHNDVRRMGGKGIKLSLTPELEEILNIVAERDLVLATGHLSVEESLVLLDQAKSVGIWKAVVNHPMSPVIGAGLEEQKEMAKLAYLEHCFVACMPGHGGLDPMKIAKAIKEIGANNCIIATDLGQAHNPMPVEGMRCFISALLRAGISEGEVDVMVKKNPAKLLGLVHSP